MIGFTPTAEQQQLVDTARGFAQRHIRPLAQRARQDGPPQDPWPLVKPVFEAGAQLGFTRLFVPQDLGGMGGTCMDAALLLEELGAADIGLASDYFALTACMPLMAMRAGSPSGEAFLKRFAEAPAMVLAGAQSEPDVAGSELMMAGPDPAFGPKLSARETADGWVLSGRKSAFITNAGAADAYFIIARSDPAQPVFTGLSIFLIPADTPGLTVGKKTKLIGWPLTTHAELVLDDVHLPADALIGQRGGAAMTFASVPEMPIGLAACFVGLARAAFEHAKEYAAERRSTGRPIMQHQTVALKLAEMAINVETARLHVWQAAAACETDPMRAAMLLAPMAKATAVDMAIRNAELAVQVLGGYGVTTEYDAGHYLKDAWIGWSCDFTRDVLHLGIAQALTGDG
ncbi:acyl-CoA/acyl-ACP dehydrogenase [Erythrobacter sp. NFXS35]|uniref:acyl-CoA dehydrogenase family protein n=1 Tax=Erythrobacter sp. NFXS35 TaxID=2818436 RepID=UPI0032DEF7F2